MGNVSELQRLRYAHQYHLAMLNLAEAKCGIMVGTSGVLIAIVDGDNTAAWFILLCLSISTFVAISSFLPKLHKSHRNKNSLLFFEDVIAQEHEDANFGISSLASFEHENNDYMHQIHELSLITDAKMKKFTASMIPFSVGVLGILVSGVIEIWYDKF